MRVRVLSRILSVGLAVLLISALASPASTEEHTPNSLEDKLNAYILPYVESMNFGGAILVAKGGRILLRKGFGMADIQAGAANSPQTSFPVGQLSESFTAAAILILEQQGKLALNDPLSKFVPDFPEGDTITIESLLMHTSGIPNVAELRDYERKSVSNQSLGETINWLKSKPPRSTKRMLFTYSSSDYILLAYIIEKASGKPYGEFLRKSIFEPLRMGDTADWSSLGRVSKTARRYVSSGPRSFEEAPYLDRSVLTGSGSLYTSVDDLYKWDRALREGSVLNEASKRKMFSAQSTGAGYGWLVRQGPWKGLNVKWSITINTRAPGLGANIERFPDEDVCVILLTNIFDSLGHSITDDLAAIALGETRTPAAPSRVFEVNKTLLDSYAGRYQFEDFLDRRMVLEVRRQRDAIALVSDTMPVTDYLIPKSDTSFVDRLYGGTVEFIQGPNGKVIGMLWKLRKEYKALKIG